MAEYQKANVLKEHFYTKEMNQQQIAEKFDVSHQTISRWMNEHGINPGQDSSHFQRKEHTTFLTDAEGYERADSYDPGAGSKEYVKIHRLVAVAEYGFDTVCGGVVHHLNGIPFDNRPVNLEVFSNPEHMEMHGKMRNLVRDERGKITGWNQAEPDGETD